MADLISLGVKAKEASRTLAAAGTAQKNKALCAMAAALREHRDAILRANEEDLKNAARAGVGKAFIDRLALSHERVSVIADAIGEIAGLADPVGMIEGGGLLENGVRLIHTRVPFGVVGIIYEARPNVTADAAALCLKSGNVCLLRGSKEALVTNRMLCGVMRGAVEETGLPADCILLVEDITREGAKAMMTLNGYLDLLIPRGGKGLIRSVVDQATVPVIETGYGNCHTYVDAEADVSMAVRILDNAKTSRPSVCNACETLLVHRRIAAAFLPKAKEALDRSGVIWRGCAKTRGILPGIEPAEPEDYAAEYNDYILAVRVVESLDDAIDHIARYTSGHSECIVTGCYENAMKFTSLVDAAAVYVNASTRFTDGGVFGLGAEIGISTQKLHVRGPMGLQNLTTDKYILLGDGQIR